MQRLDIAMEITDMFRSIHCMIHERHHRLAEEMKLSVDQFHLLVYIIDQKEPLSIGRLAGVFNLAHNTMSEKLSRMEEKGLLEKVKDESDRRIHRIQLTKKGRKLIESIRHTARKEYVANALSKMEQKDLDALHKALQETIAHMKEALDE